MIIFCLEKCGSVNYFKSKFKKWILFIPYTCKRSTNSRSPEAEDVKGEPVAKKTEMVNYILIFIVIVSNYTSTAQHKTPLHFPKLIIATGKPLYKKIYTCTMQFFKMCKRVALLSLYILFYNFGCTPTTLNIFKAIFCHHLGFISIATSGLPISIIPFSNVSIAFKING